MEQVMKFELRGDENDIIDAIKQYIPIEREDIWSWLCYFEKELPKSIEVLEKEKSHLQRHVEAGKDILVFEEIHWVREKIKEIDKEIERLKG